MNKEPIGLYIFRFILGLGLFAFMLMLYWSSVLLEQDVQILRSDMDQLKNEMLDLRTDTVKIRDDVLKAILENEKNWENILLSLSTRKAETQVNASQKKPGINNGSQLDSEFPNLLKEDPFYEVTLPKMLGKDFKIRGTFHNATVGKPDNLHPFSNWSQVADWQGLCTVGVSKQEFGKYETMSPDMAIKLEQRTIKGTDIPEFWVHLRDNVFWQPLRQDFFSENIHLAPHFLRKHQVTAHDFKFYYDAMMNPFVEVAGAVALRTMLSDIKEIEVIDNLTFVVRWKTEDVKQPDGKIIPKVKYVAKLLTGGLRPLASFVYKYFSDGTKIINEDSAPDTYRKNSVWAQNFSEHWAKNIIVSCGAWTFDGMTDRQINFKRNPDYYFPYAALAEGIEIVFRDSPDAIWQDFEADKIDSYSLQPDQLLEMENFLHSKPYEEQSAKGYGIKRLDYLNRSYTYIGWNEAKPYFQSKKVRQALTMAVDRQRIIQKNLNGLGVEITGPFYRYSPDYDPSISPWPYEPQSAKRLLEEEGWYDSTGTGVIDKVIDGKHVPFQFTLVYFVKNPTTKAICEYISTTLKEIGILCSLNGMDIADLSAAFDDKSFDAICLGWTLGSPPEDPKQLWYSTEAKLKGSSNAIGFSNKDADKIIDKLQYEYDPQKRIELYHSFDKIVHEEAPYIFLYSPKIAMVYRDYLQNVFIPANRQDLVPGANVAEPDASIFWIKKRGE